MQGQTQSKAFAVYPLRLYARVSPCTLMPCNTERKHWCVTDLPDGWQCALQAISMEVSSLLPLNALRQWQRRRLQTESLKWTALGRWVKVRQFSAKSLETEAQSTGSWWNRWVLQWCRGWHMPSQRGKTSWLQCHLSPVENMCPCDREKGGKIMEKKREEGGKPCSHWTGKCSSVAFSIQDGLVDFIMQNWHSADYQQCAASKWKLSSLTFKIGFTAVDVASIYEQRRKTKASPCYLISKSQKVAPTVQCQGASLWGRSSA